MWKIKDKDNTHILLERLDKLEKVVKGIEEKIAALPKTTSEMVHASFNPTELGLVSITATKNACAEIVLEPHSTTCIHDKPTETELIILSSDKMNCLELE